MIPPNYFFYMILWGHVYIYMYLVLIFGNVITQPCFPTLFSTCQIWHTPSPIKKETRKIIKLQNLIMICWYLLKYVKEHTHISCMSLSYLFLQHTDHCFVFFKRWKINWNVQNKWTCIVTTKHPQYNVHVPYNVGGYINDACPHATSTDNQLTGHEKNREK